MDAHLLKRMKLLRTMNTCAAFSNAAIVSALLVSLGQVWAVEDQAAPVEVVLVATGVMDLMMVARLNATVLSSLQRLSPYTRLRYGFCPKWIPVVSLLDADSIIHQTYKYVTTSTCYSTLTQVNNNHYTKTNREYVIADMIKISSIIKNRLLHHTSWVCDRVLVALFSLYYLQESYNYRDSNLFSTISHLARCILLSIFLLILSSSDPMYVFVGYQIWGIKVVSSVLSGTRNMSRVTEPCLAYPHLHLSTLKFLDRDALPWPWIIDPD